MQWSGRCVENWTVFQHIAGALHRCFGGIGVAKLGGVCDAKPEVKEQNGVPEFVSASQDASSELSHGPGGPGEPPGGLKELPHGRGELPGDELPGRPGELPGKLSELHREQGGLPNEPGELFHVSELR